MTVIRNTTLINRPIEEVFDFAVDSRNEFKWNPKVRAMTKLTDGPIGLGTRMAAKPRSTAVNSDACLDVPAGG